MLDSKAFRVFTAIIKYTCIIILFIMAFACILQVFTRFVLHMSLPWVEELATWALVWVTFLGSALASTNGSHPRIDALLLVMPYKMRCCFEALGNLISAATAVVLAYFSLPLIKHNMNYLSTGMRVPMMILYAALLVGGILMALYFIVIAIQFLVDIKKEEK